MPMNKLSVFEKIWTQSVELGFINHDKKLCYAHCAKFTGPSVWIRYTIYKQYFAYRNNGHKGKASAFFGEIFFCSEGKSMSEFFKNIRKKLAYLHDLIYLVYYYELYNIYFQSRPLFMNLKKLQWKLITILEQFQPSIRLMKSLLISSQLHFDLMLIQTSF